MPSKKDILDLYFIDARHRLIDVAAFLDRVDRHSGDADYRVEAFQNALTSMMNPDGKSRAQTVLEAFSDHSDTAASHASTQSASGAAQV